MRVSTPAAAVRRAWEIEDAPAPAYASRGAQAAVWPDSVAVDRDGIAARLRGWPGAPDAPGALCNAGENEKGDKAEEDEEREKGEEGLHCAGGRWVGPYASTRWPGAQRVVQVSWESRALDPRRDTGVTR